MTRCSRSLSILFSSARLLDLDSLTSDLHGAENEASRVGILSLTLEMSLTSSSLGESSLPWLLNLMLEKTAGALGSSAIGSVGFESGSEKSLEESDIHEGLDFWM